MIRKILKLINLKKENNINKDIIEILLDNLSYIQLLNIERNIDNYIDYTINKKDINKKYKIKTRNDLNLVLKEIIENYKIKKSNLNLEQNNNVKSTLNEEPKKEKTKK